MRDELEYAEYLGGTENHMRVEHVTCLDCELYGVPQDDFTEDKHGELCNECWLARQGEGPDADAAAEADEEPLRDPACAPDLDKDKP